MKLINLSFIKYNFLKKRYRSNLRNIIRGYSQLKKQGNISYIAELKRTLATNKLNIKHSFFSDFFFGHHIRSDLIELSIRQYLLLRIGAHNLNKVLLINKGKKNNKIIYHLPKDWINIIEKKGFNFAKSLSSVMWYSYLLLLTGYSTLLLIKIIYGSILSTIRRSSHDSSYIYFSNLTEGNIPINKSNSKSYDILNWYIKSFKKKINFKTIKHDFKGITCNSVSGIKTIVSESGPIPFLQGWGKIITFFSWGTLSVLLAFFDMMRGRWWYLFLLNQAILAKQVRLSNPKNLAVEYLFHMTNQTYRPLWTYSAEKMGSAIKLYFYSTNIEGLNLNPLYHWKCLTWPKYLVWNKHQAKFIQRSSGLTQNIEIVNHIWFSDNASVEIPKINSKKTISVFPTIPHRQIHFASYADEFEYVIPDICIPFIKDVLECAELLKINCLLKDKRYTGVEYAHPKYRHFINDSKKHPSLVLADHRISPNRIINASAMTISFPFTATANIARELGKPSCYYDPSNIVKQGHFATHRIPVINFKEDLYNWIKSNF